MKQEIETLDIGRIIYDVPLKDYNTYHVGGVGKALVIVENKEALKKLLKELNQNNEKWKIIGNGSNLIFPDGFYDGILISLEKLNGMEITGTEIYVEAGYSLAKLSIKAAKASLTGLEFAGGIPGTIGGAIFMNAGAYKSDMGYIVQTVTVLTPDLRIIKLENKEGH